MIKAIIFDCFGVVLNDSLQEIRAELSRRDPEAALEVRDIIAANNRGLIDPLESNKKISKILGLDVETFHAQVRAGETRNVRLLSYILNLRKHYKTAMLSNVAVSSLERRFPNDELKQYFDEVIASAEIGFIKPDLRAYEIAAERLCLKPNECIFTDDKPTFCDGARAVGMKAIVYTDFVQFAAELEVILADSKN